MVKPISKLLVVQAVLLTLASCAGQKNMNNIEMESIGTAEISSDGTITLYLIARGKAGEIGHAVKVYAKDDPFYAEVKNHIGPILPGEKKAVRPWEK